MTAMSRAVLSVERFALTVRLMLSPRSWREGADKEALMFLFGGFSDE